MTFLKNPVGEKLFGRIFFVYKIPKEKITFVCKVASSLAKRVSWLKFEPRSRIFPIKMDFYLCSKEIFSFGILLRYERNFSIE